VKSASPYRRLADLKGKRVAHTSPSSNSGNLAPRVLFAAEGLKTDEDYKPLMSGGHDNSVRGVEIGDYDMAAVASTTFDRMAARGAIKREDFRIIFESAIFPLGSLAHAHDLKPELAQKIKACVLGFPFPASMVQQLDGADRLVPITYKDAFAVVREVAEKSGTPYNKAAYEAEAKREAEALAKQKR
jgi:phosphonate transport system substrate-binding protein